MINCLVRINLNSKNLKFSYMKRQRKENSFIIWGRILVIYNFQANIRLFNSFYK